MKKSLSRICILTKRNLKEIFRDPISIIFMFGLPLLMEVLFYILFHGQTSQFEMKYLADYYLKMLYHQKIKIWGKS